MLTVLTPADNVQLSVVDPAPTPVAPLAPVKPVAPFGPVAPLAPVAPKPVAPVAPTPCTALVLVSSHNILVSIGAVD